MKALFLINLTISGLILPNSPLLWAKGAEGDEQMRERCTEALIEINAHKKLWNAPNFSRTLETYSALRSNRPSFIPTINLTLKEGYAALKQTETELEILKDKQILNRQERTAIGPNLITKEKEFTKRIETLKNILTRAKSQLDPSNFRLPEYPEGDEKTKIAFLFAQKHNGNFSLVQNCETFVNYYQSLSDQLYAELEEWAARPGTNPAAPDAVKNILDYDLSVITQRTNFYKELYLLLTDFENPQFDRFRAEWLGLPDLVGFSIKSAIDPKAEGPQARGLRWAEGRHGDKELIARTHELAALFARRHQSIFQLYKTLLEKKSSQGLTEAEEDEFGVVEEKTHKYALAKQSYHELAKALEFPEKFVRLRKILKLIP